MPPLIQRFPLGRHLRPRPRVVPSGPVALAQFARPVPNVLSVHLLDGPRVVAAVHQRHEPEPLTLAAVPVLYHPRLLEARVPRERARQGLVGALHAEVADKDPVIVLGPVRQALVLPPVPPRAPKHGLADLLHRLRRGRRDRAEVAVSNPVDARRGRRVRRREVHRLHSRPTSLQVGAGRCRAGGFVVPVRRGGTGRHRRRLRGPRRRSRGDVLGRLGYDLRARIDCWSGRRRRLDLRRGVA